MNIYQNSYSHVINNDGLNSPKLYVLTPTQLRIQRSRFIEVRTINIFRISYDTLLFLSTNNVLSTTCSFGYWANILIIASLICLYPALTDAKLKCSMMPLLSSLIFHQDASTTCRLLQWPTWCNEGWKGLPWHTPVQSSESNVHQGLLEGGGIMNIIGTENLFAKHCCFIQDNPQTVPQIGQLVQFFPHGNLFLTLNLHLLPRPVPYFYWTFPPTLLIYLTAVWLQFGSAYQHLHHIPSIPHVEYSLHPLHLLR